MTGRPPKEFEVDENGYISIDTEEHLKVQQAIEKVEEGESHRSVAKSTDMSRLTLMRLHKERKGLYLDSEEIEDECLKMVVKSK